MTCVGRKLCENRTHSPRADRGSGAPRCSCSLDLSNSSLGVEPGARLAYHVLEAGSKEQPVLELRRSSIGLRHCLEIEGQKGNAIFDPFEFFEGREQRLAQDFDPALLHDEPSFEREPVDPRDAQ